MKQRLVALAAAAVLTATSGALAVRAQDKPTRITGKLPARAECVICSRNGEGHGEEKAAAGVRYKGKPYYFCSKGEVAAFEQDPDAFLPPVLPRPAPAAPLKSLTGDTATLASYKGKVVLVDFWATWCAPCVKTMPDVQKLHGQYGAKGFTAVGVSVDEGGAKTVKRFLDKRKFTYPMLLDAEGKASERFGVRAIPALFLLDRDGNIVRQWTGSVDKETVEKAVVEALGG
jgi:peroxiredoxin